MTSGSEFTSRPEDSMRLFHPKLRFAPPWGPGRCQNGTEFRKSKQLRCLCRRDVCNPMETSAIQYSRKLFTFTPPLLHDPPMT